MHLRLKIAAVAVLVALWTLAWALATPLVPYGIAATARPASTAPAPRCGMAQRAVAEASGGIWTLSRPNPFGMPAARAAAYCIQPAAAGPGFTVTRNATWNGTVRAFPFTGIGCAYSLCSRSTPLPLRVSALPRAANMSWDWRGNAPGYWNASVDLWFGKTGQTTAQDNGAELMVWLHTPAGYGSTPGVDFRMVKIGHRRYWFTAWRAHHGNVSWWYIQFRTPATVHGIRQLWMRPFIRYAQSRGLLRPSWYLTSAHAGYEIWSGGRGLQTTWFNTHV